MTTTTMHFGPEWMRPKLQTPVTPRFPHDPSPPPPAAPAPPGASSYSALVAPAPVAPPERHDETHPFKYSREDMLKIYKEGGGRGGLGLEVERWDGVVREVACDPVALKEMSEAEKKLFTGPLNSELRRRQSTSTDYLSPILPTLGGDRPKLLHANSGSSSPMRDRFGALARRKDGAEPPSSTVPRKLSLSSAQGPLHSPRDLGQPSPRVRTGFTPGFDGVLSGPDAWGSRRRALSSARTGEFGGTDVPKESPVKEEEESAADLSSSNTTVDDPNISNQLHNNAEDNTKQTATSISPAPSHSTTNSQLIGQPSPMTTADGSMDFASVEWSYIDLQGLVQGPFRADIMQNWHDEGYFTPDLVMKRTHLDTDWISVGDMIQRAGNNQIFLLPPQARPAGPPGLSRMPDPTMEPFVHQGGQNGYGAPYQPVPTRGFRSTTLDSYLDPSNTAESPSSSFSTGRYVSGSPGPGAYGGGGAMYSAVDPVVGSRLAGFSAAPEPPMPFGNRRGAFQDPAVDAYGGGGMSPSAYGGMVPRSPGLANIGYGAPMFRGQTNGVPGFVANYGAPIRDTAYPTQTSLNELQGYGRQMSDPVGMNGAQYSSMEKTAYLFNNRDFTAQLPLSDDSAVPSASVPEPTVTPTFVTDPTPASAPAFAPSPPVPSSIPYQAADLPSLTVPSAPEPIAAPSTAAQAPSTAPLAVQADTSSGRRPAPFDAPHPKVTNTVPADPIGSAKVTPALKPPVTPAQAPAWNRTASQGSQAAAQVQSQSPWYTASHGVVEEGWGEVRGPSSLTFSNVMQHNQLLGDKNAPATDKSALVEAPLAEAPTPAAAPAIDTTTHATPAEAPAASSGRRGRKTTTTAVSSAAPTATNAADVAPAMPAAAQPKAAWTVEQEKKAKPSGVSLGFREIQQAEAKKVDAQRKAVERERAVRTSTSAPSPQAEDGPAFTASWGLPTSQTRAAASLGAAKEPAMTATSPGGTPASGTANANGAVWTTAPKAQPAKKTMKEIQEEEERRKKVTKEKETVAAAAARRGYAETTNKAKNGPAGAPVVAWTTVGPSGKVGAPVPAPARPTLASVASSTSAVASAASRPANGTTAIARPATAPKAATPAVSTPRLMDEFPTAPSPDFLKWLMESLKGLNSSVNLEEIASMLLSFPLDPDPSTAEIISDLIYANSTTLDGRRFASDYVSRRKADASGRPRAAAMTTSLSGSGAGAGASGVGGKGGAGAISIADVVKAQPKPAQNEWGGFKVVNKKKKSGRA